VTLVDAGRIRHLGTWIRSVRQIAAIAKQKRAQIILSWMSKGHLYGAPAGALVRMPATVKILAALRLGLSFWVPFTQLTAGPVLLIEASGDRKAHCKIQSAPQSRLPRCTV
jgi:hypothetical protein